MERRYRVESMDPSINIFEKFLFTEAPGDDPPDAGGEEASAAPDIPDDAAAQDGPPDLPDTTDDTDVGDAAGDDGPPDIGGADDAGNDDFEDTGNYDGETNNNGEQQKELKLDGKVSAIMNMNLYQRFLTLLNTINSQLSMIKNNSDMIYALSPEAPDIIGSLKKLDENIRLYLDNIFVNENYSRNLLFFDKCLNLLKLLNDAFDGSIQKGIKAM